MDHNIYVSVLLVLILMGIGAAVLGGPLGYFTALAAFVVSAFEFTKLYYGMVEYGGNQ